MQVHDFGLFGETSRPLAAHREGSTVLTCSVCGCRLMARESIQDGAGYGPDAAWRHYPGSSWDADARGCRVQCADRPHRIAAEEPEG